MNKKIYILFALTAGLFLSAHASENVNTPENRQFLKQQETLSQQLREKPDTQLQAWAEQQVRANKMYIFLFIEFSCKQTVINRHNEALNRASLEIADAMLNTTKIVD